MAELSKCVGESNFDDILVGNDPVAYVATVELAKSETPLVRGTVIVETEGKCAPIKAALTADSIVYVLADNFESAEDGDYAVAYKTGCFAKTRMITNGSYELAGADFDFMRKAGLITRDMVEMPEAE